MTPYLNLTYINISSIPPFTNGKSVIQQHKNWWLISNEIVQLCVMIQCKGSDALFVRKSGFIYDR